MPFKKTFTFYIFIFGVLLLLKLSLGLFSLILQTFKIRINILVGCLFVWIFEQWSHDIFHIHRNIYVSAIWVIFYNFVGLFSIEVVFFSSLLYKLSYKRYMWHSLRRFHVNHHRDDKSVNSFVVAKLIFLRIISWFYLLKFTIFDTVIKSTLTNKIGPVNYKMV